MLFIYFRLLFVVFIDNFPLNGMFEKYFGCKLGFFRWIHIIGNIRFKLFKLENKIPILFLKMDRKPWILASSLLMHVLRIKAKYMYENIMNQYTMINRNTNSNILKLIYIKYSTLLCYLKIFHIRDNNLRNHFLNKNESFSLWIIVARHLCTAIFVKLKY